VGSFEHPLNLSIAVTRELPSVYHKATQGLLEAMGEHLSDKLIAFYCNGDIKDVREIEAHLLQCGECARKVSDVICADVNTKRKQSRPII
jgi:hypothetical protein